MNAMHPGRVIGHPVTRLEDAPLVRGEGLFAADVNFPRQLSMRIVRAQIAHGHLLSIDTAAARALPGVTAVWTRADIAGIPPIPFRATKLRGLEPYCQPILATDRVRYAGEPIAAVFAETAYIAEDAADLVLADIDQLPPLLDATAEPGAFAARPRAPNPPSSTRAIRRRGRRVRAPPSPTSRALELSVGRHSGVPLETRGAIARYDAATDVLELHGTAKKQHWNRDEIARLLGRSPQHGVHLFEGHVGGGFGVRGELYPEDLLVCARGAAAAAADQVDRGPAREPGGHQPFAPATHHRIRAAVDEAGAACSPSTTCSSMTRAPMSAPTAPASRTWLRGCCPARTGCRQLPRRRPFPPHQQDARRHLPCPRPLRDELRAGAADGRDRRPARPRSPIEVRRRNLVTAAEMPHARPLDALGTDIVLDSGDYPGLLDQRAAAVRLDRRCRWNWPRRRARRRMRGRRTRLLRREERSRAFGRRAHLRGRHRWVGRAGQRHSSSVGQGVETVVGADLRLRDPGRRPTDRIRVVRGRTDRIEFGNGAHASRVTVMSGSAAHLAGRRRRSGPWRWRWPHGLLQASARRTLTIVDGVVMRARWRHRVPLHAAGGGRPPPHGPQLAKA